MVESNPGHWEVVGGKPSKGKSTKSSKNSKNASNKTAAANFSSKTIKVDELVSPFESQYAILDPELRAMSKREALGLPDKPAAEKPKVKTAASKEVPKKKPSKDAGKENQLKSLPDALKQINIKELNDALAEAKVRFSTSPVFLLKSLTSYLNNHLNVEPDAAFSGKPVDYPSSLISSELKKSITSTFASCNHETLQVFYEQTLIMMPTDINRGLQVCGTKLVLQQLSYYKPSLVLDNLSRIQEILRANESLVPALLSVLWVTSQAGYKDARIGAKVWMEAMLPLINLKKYGAYVAQVAVYLTAKVQDVKLKADTIVTSDYFNLVDLVAGSSLPAIHRKEVAAFVSALTQPMIAVNSAKMFAPLLHRLNSNTDDLCRNLVQCLKSDSRAFDSWRKEYKSNLRASSHLLKYCVDQEPAWTKSSQEFRTSQHHFHSINSSLMASAKHPDGLKSCHQLIESLVGGVEPKKKSPSSLKSVNYLLLITLVSLVYYDIRTNGQGEFAGSRMGLAFERHGVNAKVAQALQHYEPYLNQVRDVTQPLLDSASVYVNLLKEKSQPLIDSASALVDIISEKAQPLMESAMAQTKMIVDIVSEKSRPLMDSAVAQTMLMVDMISEKSKPITDNMLVYADQLKTTILQKGGEYHIEVSKAIGALSVVLREQSSVAVDLLAVYSTVAKEKSVELLQKVVEFSAAATQSMQQTLAQVMDDERVQQGLSYSYEMYHKALHLIGICTH